MIFFECLTFCIQETHKRLLIQTVKTQMKCCIMLHFIRVYTVCKCKKDLQTKNTIFFYNYNLTPLDMYNGLSQVYCIKAEERIGLIFDFYFTLSSEINAYQKQIKVISITSEMI